MFGAMNKPYTLRGNMTDEKLRVAIIGCGRMGQQYAEVYNTFENTEIVAIAEYNDERRKVVGERFGVKALYKDAEEMYQQDGRSPRSRRHCGAPRQVHQGRGDSLGTSGCARVFPPISPLAPSSPTWTR